jgi:predicted cupin superfamily sugar epimerase
MRGGFAIAGDLGANEVRRMLDLQPHPEGGWFRETFRDVAGPDGRPRCTIIWFLLEAGEVWHWHRVDATEAWFWHAGGPLALSVSQDGISAQAAHLGPDLRARQRPHFVVPAKAWQAAETLGAWTLVSCAVAPGFDFAGFELAPADWYPGRPLPTPRS